MVSNQLPDPDENGIPVPFWLLIVIAFILMKAVVFIGSFIAAIVHLI